MDAITVQPTTFLPHHRLRVWHKAVELVQFVRAHRIEDAELRAHANDASRSVALNVAEAAGLGGGAARRHFTIARGSAIEVAGSYELACALGERHPLAELLERTTTIAAMLSGLCR